MILRHRAIDGHALGREVCLVLGDDVLLRICAVVKIARDIHDRKPVLAVLAQRIVKEGRAVRLLFDRPAVRQEHLINGEEPVARQALFFPPCLGQRRGEVEIDARDGVCGDVTGQDLRRDIEEAHVGNVLRLNALHGGEDDVGAHLNRDKVGIGTAHGKLRDKAAVAAADLQFDGIAVSEQISVINKGTVRQRRFFQIFNRFPARNKERRARFHARF